MQRSGTDTISKAGRSIRISLRQHYGTPEAAEQAVRELAENPKLLEAWATDVSGEIFRFDSFPASMKEAAVLTMAMAMLEHRSRTKRGAA